MLSASRTPVGGQIGGPEGAALGTYGNRDTPPLPARRQEGRQTRHRLKVAQRHHTDSKSSRLCWHAAAVNVALNIGRSLTAQVSGITRCGSPWACPVCAPPVRERRARDIDQATAEALAKGWTVLFVTLTVPHHLGDDLAGRLDTIGQALRLTLNGSGWERRRQRYGYSGAIKAVEVTWGPRHGWHPHAHSLLFFEGKLTDDEVADLERWGYGRWLGVCERKGYGTPNRAHGIDVRRVTTTDDLGGYLTKIEGGWGAGLELARADLKRSNGGNVPATALLSEFAATGDARALQLWREYELATFGRRAIVWSPGLRAKLLPDVEEVTDVEAAAAEGIDLTLLRALIPAGDWRTVVRAGMAGDLLTDFEHTAAAVLLLCDLWGVPVHPLDPPTPEEP